MVVTLLCLAATVLLMTSTRPAVWSPASLRSTSTRPTVRSPALLRSVSPLIARSASTPFARSASPFVRLEKTIPLGRLSKLQPRQKDADLPPELEDFGSDAGSHSCRPKEASPRSTEYCCAICIDLLLRPVRLSCGHTLCRGCWVRVLQGSQARAVASRTGNATCPLGRCEVRPCVPEVDRDLESKMRSRLGFKQLASHAAAAELAPLDEESAAAAAVNAWAAAGCKLDEPEEFEAAAVFDAEAVAAAFAIEADRPTTAWETFAAYRDVSCLLIMISLIAAGFFIMNNGVGKVCGLPTHTNGR